MIPDPLHGLGGALATVTQGRDCAQSLPFGALENAVDDLVLDQSAHESDVSLGVLQIDEPAERVEEFGGRLRSCHRRAARMRP
jgi:hypothetical protein